MISSSTGPSRRWSPITKQPEVVRRGIRIRGVDFNLIDGEEVPGFPLEAREEIAKDISESILIPLKTGTFPH